MLAAFWTEVTVAVARLRAAVALTLKPGPLIVHRLLVRAGHAASTRASAGGPVVRTGRAQIVVGSARLKCRFRPNEMGYSRTTNQYWPLVPRFGLRRIARVSVAGTGQAVNEMIFLFIAVSWHSNPI
ncbi:hypothetical protein GCM10007886_30150 [Methylobacterium gregans]|nr:hypothetical protein GCM10007886_30150 [Methylobacterium gregans]